MLYEEPGDTRLDCTIIVDYALQTFFNIIFVCFLYHSVCVCAMPTDINECEVRDTCQHECINTPGSHRCLCPAGYRLTTNGKTCQGEDPPPSPQPPHPDLSSSPWPVLVISQLCLCDKLFCCISRCRRVSGAEHPMWSEPNVLQHERKLPVYRHTLSVKLPERSSHRVNVHRNGFTI